MKYQPTHLAACASLALMVLSAACGKKPAESETDDGPESAQGALLESVQKTVDEANERTRQVKESGAAATE